MLPEGTSTQIKTVFNFEKNIAVSIGQVREALIKLCPDNHCQFDTVDLVSKLNEYRRQSTRYIHETHPTMNYDFENVRVMGIFEIYGDHCAFWCQWILFSSEGTPLMKANEFTRVSKFQLYY